MTQQISRATIAALATAPMPAGIAVIRMSGSKTRTAIHALFRGKKDPVALPRSLVFGEFLDHSSDEVIDKGLCVYMPGPNSFTGEDIGEFQFHGSLLLVEKILRSLFSWGITPAEPGEFTKRAFLNGKMDLVQAEAVADIITASSERALRLASDQFQGKFSQSIEMIAEPLRDTLAEIEANIDFPEEDISPDSQKSILHKITGAKNEIGKLLETYAYGATVKEGFRVLLCGKPNAGKSSLLNSILGKKRAIVSDISGTTRDFIEEEAIIDGFRFRFCDSAGLSESDNEIEKIGISLTKEKFSWADLILFLVDASDDNFTWKETLQEIFQDSRKIWLVVNKIDLKKNVIGTIPVDSRISSQVFYLSTKTGSGLKSLFEALVDEVRGSQESGDDAVSVIVTNERQKNCLVKALESLNVVLTHPDLPLEILAAEVRGALLKLEELVGKTTTEDILGRIFSKFCIGK